ncbi:TPA: transposase family protein, partial [Escherichia coli]|nr:transposase family protein [Escherichia coli]
QVVTAMLCGMKTWDEIEGFGEENLTWFRKFSDYSSGVPSHDQGKFMNMPVFTGFVV